MNSTTTTIPTAAGVGPGSTRDYQVEVKSNTWNKDSHGLFDYENSDKKMEKFRSEDSFKIFRKDTFVFTASAGTTLYKSAAHDVILHVVHNEDSTNPDEYYVQAPKRAKINDPLPNDVFLVVRPMKDELAQDTIGHELQPGETFKLGRVEFRVVEVMGTEGGVRKCNSSTANLSTRSAYHPGVDITGMQPWEAPHCRICLTDSKEDILYSPCTCKGSLGYVHVRCQKEWVLSKVATKMSGPNTVNYNVAPLYCEICKVEIDPVFVIEEKQYDLIHFERPEWPYMIIEQLERASTSRQYHLLSFFQTDSITLGRGHGCDIRLADISVSRVHASIRSAKNGKFILVDNNSKFGTLVLVDKDFKLTSNKVGFQVGKTILIACVKKKNLGPGISTELPKFDTGAMIIEDDPKLLNSHSCPVNDSNYINQEEENSPKKP